MQCIERIGMKHYYEQMIEITDAELEKWKESFAKDGIVYKTDKEYRSAISNLLAYFDILIEMDKKQKRKEQDKNDETDYVY